MIDTLGAEEAYKNHGYDSSKNLLNFDFEELYYPDVTTDVFSIFDSQDKRTRFWQPHFEELPREKERPKPSNLETPQVELSPLPKGLKHAFLGP